MSRFQLIEFVRGLWKSYTRLYSGFARRLTIVLLSTMCFPCVLMKNSSSPLNTLSVSWLKRLIMYAYPVLLCPSFSCSHTPLFCWYHSLLLESYNKSPCDLNGPWCKSNEDVHRHWDECGWESNEHAHLKSNSGREMRKFLTIHWSVHHTTNSTNITGSLGIHT